MYSDFLKISKQIGLPIKKVLDIFWYLSKGESIKNNELVKLVGVSKNTLNQVKKALFFYLNPTSEETSLKESLLKKISSLYTKEYFVEESLLATLTKSNVYSQSIKLLSNLSSKRPYPKREYDQFTATCETVAKRVSLLDFFGDIKSKKILFLGDDDFTSIATANIKSAQEVGVVDIDLRILNNIGIISNELDLGIKRIKHDLKKPVPADLIGRFDTVFTDPPYTKEGVELFVSRALVTLDRENKSARVYLCYGNSDRAKERFLPIHEIIIRSGLMIRWVFDKFNRYEGAESIGNSSSLFVTEVTPKTRPLILKNYNKPIYTAE